MGALLSAALRYALPGPPGFHLRLAYHHVAMHGVHGSDALVLGVGRQFEAARPAPDTAPRTRTRGGTEPFNRPSRAWTRRMPGHASR